MKALHQWTSNSISQEEEEEEEEEDLINLMPEGVQITDLN